MPVAYAIAQIDVHDPETYAKYTARTTASVAAFGGAFVVRAGRWEAIEGDAPRSRVVVIEFPSFEAAKAWYGSESYQAIVPIRQSASEGSLFFVEGAE